MSNIVNINFDNGFKRVVLNGDESRVIMWNPSDINLIDKLNNFMQWVETDFKAKIEKELSGGIDSKDGYKTGALIQLSNKLSEEIDLVFNAGASAAAFQGASPLSPTAKGTFAFENFLEAMAPLVELSVNEYQKASGMYTGAAKKSKKQLSKGKSK